MNTIFKIVYSILMWIADFTGFTYNEINIIAFYIVLPFIYIFLIDKILKKNFLKIAYIAAVGVGLFLIKDFTTFSDWLFQRSVNFLLSFEILGWNYVVASVLICVVFPGIVFAVMFYIAYPKLIQAAVCNVPK